MVHRLKRVVRGASARGEDGAAALLTVLLTTMVFIGLCALVVDLGMARDTRRQAQNAADASALAAGNVLYLSGTSDIAGATTAAKSYATANYGVTATDWATCTDTLALAYHPDTACISFDSASKPASIRVNVPVRQVNTPFAGIWGTSSVPVGASAQMQLAPGGPAKCGLCVIGTDTVNLRVGDIIVSQANIAINGPLNTNNANAVVTVGNGFDINLTQNSMPPGTYPPGEPHLSQLPLPDPLAGLSMPSWVGLPYHTNSCTEGPGIYVQLQETSCTMQPGLYVLTGTAHFSGSTNIVATAGVTLYYVCSTAGVPRPCAAGGEVGAGMQWTGQASLDIKAPSTGPNAGLAIVSDRNNTSAFSFRGNGAANSGTIYAARGTLDFRGNGGSTLDSLVVVGNLSFSGTSSDFSSTYTQSANVAIPSSDMHLSQ